MVSILGQKPSKLVWTTAQVTRMFEVFSGMFWSYSMKPPVRFDSKRFPPIETEPRPVRFRTTGSDGSGSYRFQIGGLLDEVPKLIVVLVWGLLDEVPKLIVVLVGDFWAKYPN